MRAHEGGRACRRFHRLSWLALFLLLSAVVVAAGGLTREGVAHAAAAPTLGAVHSASAGNCSSSDLARITIDPANVHVLPLSVEVFSAEAVNACGAPVGPGAVYSWSLSSVELGSLNTTTGSTVAYTACLASMAGVLHLRTAMGPVTLFTNSSVSVAGQGVAGSSPTSSGSSNPAGGSGDPSIHLSTTEGIVVVAGIFALAGVVLALGLRKRP